jgi:CLIP-associating protein 1/2
MTVLRRTLKDLNEEWTTRAAALEQLVRLAQSAAQSGTLDEFIRRFDEHHLLDCLAVQVEDRRSTLCKDACQTATRVADAFGARWEPYGCRLMPVLFRLLVVTTKIIADSAHRCIMSFLKHTCAGIAVATPGNCLEVVINALGDIHPAVRAHCSTYMLQLLHTSSQPNQWLSEEVSVVFEAALLRILNDAAAPVRAVAKQVWQQYRTTFPTRAQAFLERQDGVTQKRVCLKKRQIDR